MPSTHQTTRAGRGGNGRSSLRRGRSFRGRGKQAAGGRAVARSRPHRRRIRAAKVRGEHVGLFLPRGENPMVIGIR